MSQINNVSNTVVSANSSDFNAVNTIGTLAGDNQTITADLALLPEYMAEAAAFIKAGQPVPESILNHISQLTNEIQSAANDIDKIAQGTGPQAEAAKQEITNNTTFQALFGTDTDGKGLVGGDFNDNYLFQAGGSTPDSVYYAMENMVDLGTLTAFEKDISNFNPAA